MALAYYETETQRLLQNPGAPITLYDPTDIDSYVNSARGQLAGESECIRYLGSITATPGLGVYNFADIDTGVPATTGIQGVIHIRSLMCFVGEGYQWITPRSWEWYQLFHLSNPVPPSGFPTVWSQFMQGAAPPGTNAVGVGSIGGNFFVDPTPDLPYFFLLDCVCFPIALLDDSTVEAIPYLWTDAVPFYAAWKALLSSQTAARRQDAEAYYGYYKQYVQRARMAANPSVNRFQYEQVQDIAMANKMGVSAGGKQ